MECNVAADREKTSCLNNFGGLFPAAFSTCVLISRHVTRLHLARFQASPDFDFSRRQSTGRNETRRIHLIILRVKGISSSLWF
jgi:hypothetical protein